MKSKISILNLCAFTILLFATFFLSCEKEAFTESSVSTASETQNAQSINDETSEITFRSAPRERKHAPYLFLAKTGSTSYEMFIIVPVNDGERITAGNFVSEAGNTSKKLDIAVVADTSVHEPYAVMHKPFSVENASFLDVVVNVDNPTATDYYTKLDLGDANEGSSIVAEGGLAYGCPYAYLAKNTTGEFVPYALLPLKADQMAADPMPSGNINCVHEISITSQFPTTVNRIENKLNLNTDGFSYPDPNSMTSGGVFNVTTSPLGGGVVSGQGVSGVKIKNKNSNST